MNDRDQQAEWHHHEMLMREQESRERDRWHDDVEQRNRTIAEPQPPTMGIPKEPI